MDTATLAKAMGNVPGVNYGAYTEPFNRAMTQAGATTFLRRTFGTTRTKATCVRCVSTAPIGN